MELLNFLLNKYVLLILGFVIMFIGLLPEYTLKAVRMIGMMGWAESSIGRGGTFTVWKIIGIVAPIIAIMYFFTPSMQIHFGPSGEEPVDQQTYYDSNIPTGNQYQNYNDSYYQ